MNVLGRERHRDDTKTPGERQMAAAGKTGRGRKNGGQACSRLASQWTRVCRVPVAVPAQNIARTRMAVLKLGAFRVTFPKY